MSHPANDNFFETMVENEQEFNQSVDYMTERVMPMNRAKGCQCEYSPQSYANGTFHHEVGCPSPYIENSPNPKLLDSLREV